MIPKIIHQTWRDENLPVPSAMPESWRHLNPDWQYRFWTDDSLSAFVEQHYPDEYALYQAAKMPVMRADIGRYLLLHHFGGIYADIDTTCLAPLDVLADETRVVLSCEPTEHWSPLVTKRNMPYLVFNGIIASPQGHRFWLDVIAALHRCQYAREVLESTGPLMLSGTVMNYDHPDEIALNSCHLFNPNTKDGVASTATAHGPHADLRLADHHWAGSWIGKARRPSVLEWILTLRLMGEYWLSRGRYLRPETLHGQTDVAMLTAPMPSIDHANLPTIAILIPVRDAAPHLDRCFALLNALDYPKDRISVTFMEGDSRDSTVADLQALIGAHAQNFRQMQMFHYQTGYRIKRATRWLPALQKKRRMAIARVRNALLAKGFQKQHDYALWLDVDVCDYRADILHVLLAAQAKIVMPECTRIPGGPSFDLNAFLDVQKPSPLYFYSHAQGGLFQPRENFYGRRHMHDFRYLKRVPLTGVGGTMLLVHGSVHRAGLNFPERPYCNLLQTEAFGKWASDLGVAPIGLPQVEILHSPD